MSRLKNEVLEILTDEQKSEYLFLYQSEGLQEKLSWLLSQLSKPPLSNLGQDRLLELLAHPEQLKEYQNLKNFFLNPKLPTRLIAIIAISQRLLANRPELSNLINNCLFTPHLDFFGTEEELLLLSAKEWRVLYTFLQTVKIKRIVVRIWDSNEESSILLLKAIVLSEVNELVIEGKEISEPKRWEAFLTCLETKSLTHLTLKNCRLDQLDTISWKALCSKIAVSGLTSLCFELTDLCSLNATQWRELFAAIKTAKITSLSLSGNQLDNLDPDSWQLLCSLIKDCEISSLDLSENRLHLLNEASCQVIADMLEHSTIRALDISNSVKKQEILAPDFRGWQWLLSIILKSKLTSLTLRSNCLDLLGAAEWQAVCEFIQLSQLKELDLGYNALGRRDDAEWQRFIAAIRNHPTLNSLDLSGCILAQLNDSNWESLCDVISTSILEYLGLECNSFEEVNNSNCRKLFEAFEISNLSFIDLRDNDLSATHWQIVKQLIPANYHFTVSFDGSEQSQSLQTVIYRNFRMVQVRLLATKALESKPERTTAVFISQLDKALAELNEILKQVSNSASLSANKLRAQIQNICDELLWSKACSLHRENISASEPSSLYSTHAKLVQKLECLTEISANSQHYENARIDIFEATLQHSDPERSRLANFIEALGWLFTPNLNPLCLKSYINQRLVDSYLLTTAGGKFNFWDVNLTPTLRSTILQYLLLLDTKELLQQRKSENNAFLILLKLSRATASDFT